MAMMKAANQYASGDAMDYLANSGQQTVGAGVNAGTALPNLDPKKMSAMDQVATRRAPLALAAGPQPASTYSPIFQPAPAGGPDSRYQQYMTPQEAQGARGSVDFAAQGTQLKQQAGGQTSPKQQEADAIDAQRLNNNMRAMASRDLQSRGFADASSLGLDYARDIDRQVGELMIRRQADHEKSAQQDYMTWMAQNEARRQALQNEAMQRQRLAMDQNQFDQLHGKTASKKNLGKTIGAGLGGVAGFLLPGVPGGSAAGATVGGALGGALGDWIGSW